MSNIIGELVSPDLVPAIGELVSSDLVPAIERQEIRVETEEIEDFLRPGLEKGGWKVEFEWYISQCATLVIRRTREVK